MGQGKLRWNGTVQSRTEWDGERWNGTVQSRTEWARERWNGTGHDGTKHRARWSGL